MRYEIEKLDGLYCVFENQRIIAAFETKQKAEEHICEIYAKRRKEKGNNENRAGDQGKNS